MKKFTAGIMLLFLLFTPVYAQAQTLIPGGQVIGIRLGDPLTVAAFQEGSTAQAMGMQIGDRITHINNTNVHTVAELQQTLSATDGPVAVSFIRNGQPQTVSVSPKNGLLGIYMKQCVTGIGTVTYYDPVSGDFGALGHGVNDKNGALLPENSGTVYGASVVSVQPGASGEPGRLVGSLRAADNLGQLDKNTPQGIFGTLNTLPDGTLMETGEPRLGDAVIRSTVKDKQLQEYSVKILKIYPSDRQNGRNMLLRITDPQLLDTTNGIVQGMSGSPIIQDGKLIGAVTHVLVNDPTTGYGIFIENMLDAAA